MTAGRRRTLRRALAPLVVLAGFVGAPVAAGAATGVGAAMVATCDTTTWSVELSLTNADVATVTVASFTASGVPDDAFAPLGTGSTIAPGATVRGSVSGLALSLADVSVAVAVSGATDPTPIVRGISRPPGCDAASVTPGAPPAPAVTVPGTIAATSSRDSVAPTTAAEAAADPASTSTTAAATTTTLTAVAAAPTTTVAAAPTATTVVAVAAAPTTPAATATSAGATTTVAAPTTTSSGVSTSAAAAPVSSSRSSSTGWWWLLAVVVLVGLGALLLVARRRRRHATWVLPAVPATAVVGAPGAGGPSVFLSACAEDRDAVADLAAAFTENGFAVTHDLDADQPDSSGARSALGRAIEHATAVLVVVSPAATRSVEVARHVAVADDTRTPVVPVLVAGEPVLEGLLGYVLADASPIDLRGPARRIGTARALQVVRAMVARGRLDPPPPGARPLPAPTALASQSGPTSGTPRQGAGDPGSLS